MNKDLAKKNNNLKVRIPMYFVGLFLMTIGIAISVKSNLGVSPVSSIPYTCLLYTSCSITLPPSIKTTFVAASFAKSSSWVTTIMVTPSFASSLITFSTSPTISGSRADVGSSKRISSGFLAIALAIPTRCC